MEEEVQGKITIAPVVLTTIVRQTTLEQPGVRRLSAVPPKMRGLLAPSATDEGIYVAVTEAGVEVEVHLVAAPDSNMLKLGSLLQEKITRAMEVMVGMPVAKVDVFIDDVAMDARRPE